MSQLELFEEMEQEFQKDFINPLDADNSPTDLTGLFELSVDACYAALYAQMSCLPISKEISRFIKKVKKAGKEPSNGKTGDDRVAADRAATDRSDHDVLVVLNAAGKVRHEIHRLTGLLRFSRESNGMYIARCAPDHFILPALAEHFSLRFGDTPWAIIDEKRDLSLCREDNNPARLIQASSGPSVSQKDQTDFWEDLWRLYHHSINNESRKNLKLQRQLMPKRYHKYLTELES